MGVRVLPSISVSLVGCAPAVFAYLALDSFSSVYHGVAQNFGQEEDFNSCEPRNPALRQQQQSTISHNEYQDQEEILETLQGNENQDEINSQGNEKQDGMNSQVSGNESQDEMDPSWKNLLHGDNIRFTSDELLGKPSEESNNVPSNENQDEMNRVSGIENQYEMNFWDKKFSKDAVKNIFTLAFWPSNKRPRFRKLRPFLGNVEFMKGVCTRTNVEGRGKSKIFGVTKQRKSWIARYKTIYLGNYKTKEIAAKALDIGIISYRMLHKPRSKKFERDYSWCYYSDKKIYEKLKQIIKAWEYLDRKDP